MPGRTFVIGDIHGDLEHLDRLLTRLPEPKPEDTVVFLGDYVDRGAHSRGVIDRVRSLPAKHGCKYVYLQGNHESAWLERYPEANISFLLPESNGCLDTYRSFIGRKDDAGEPTAEQQTAELLEMLNLPRWFPADIAAWMRELALWYEDDHAIYVHAGVDRNGTGWKHPSESRPESLLWLRRSDFWKNYQGKRLIFGHTVTTELPRADSDEGGDDSVWIRGDLVGLDTGCGKGGYLSAIELPSLAIYSSR